MDWADLLPPRVAARQKAWERAQRMRWAYEATPRNVSYEALGKASGLSKERVRKLICYAQLNPVSPIARWIEAGEHSMAYQIAHGPLSRPPRWDHLWHLFVSFREAGMLGDGKPKREAAHDATEDR